MRVRRAVVWTVVLAISLLLIGHGQEIDVIGLKDGGFVQGRIVAGVPPLIGMELASGEKVTLSRDNLKVLYLGTEAGDQVETRDGNVLVGEVTGLAPVITVETEGGDVITLSPDNIEFIRFAVVPPVQTTPSPVPPPTQPCLDSLLDAYRASHWSLGIGLGYFLLGLVERNGFGYPLNAFGFSATLGAFFRHYWAPHPLVIEEELSERCAEACDEQELEEAVAVAVDCLDISRFPYLQVGTDFLVLLGVGAGMSFPLGKGALFDVGVVFNPNIPVWKFIPYLGIIVVF